MRAYRLSMSAAPGSLKVMRCTSNLAVLSSVSSTPSAPASAGVTDGQRTRSRAMERASVAISDRPSIPQQFVDAGLGAGAFVDAFDDDRAGGGRTGLAVLQRLARQRARHHHG